MYKVLIADDHEMVREGLRRVIEEDPAMTVVAQASCGSEVLPLCRETRPDVVVLDWLMPGRDGPEIISDVKRWNGRVGVLMLTALPESDYALRSLRAGADGFLNKMEASATLVEALRKLLRGEKHISGALATQLAIMVGRDDWQTPHDRLSVRELQVLRYLGSGRTVSEIAAELNLSVKTISTYRSRALEKLELKNNAGIMRYALEHGLTD